jgi:hypothetical protein
VTARPRNQRPRNPLRILLAGTFAAVPGQGGATWAVLQYALGFRRLGHDVLLVEPAPADPAVVAYFDRVVAGAGLAGRAALLHPGRTATGMPYPDVARFAAAADVVVNLAGVLDDAELTGPAARRLYVDLDPAFTQLWHAEGIDMHLAGHDAFASVGGALGTAGCPVPTAGVAWIPTLPPVVLDAWTVSGAPPRHGFTTVGHWRSYGSVTVAGVHYGQKAHALRALLDLPRRVPAARFEPALAIHPGDQRDRDALVASGWCVLDPSVFAADPDRYRAFVGASTAEIGVAKSGYVASRCGWFSDRSACYLASGRPVVAQETGWSRFLPAGEGLLAFTDTDSAAGAVGSVLSDWRRHAKAARMVAEDLLDARVVLARLLDSAGVAA